MSKKKCSQCGHQYWVNIYVDDEYACPKCGFVEDERIVGQLRGRIAVGDD